MKRNALKIIIVVFLDLAMFASLLFSFAWFHHARPQKFAIGGETVAPIDLSSDPVPTTLSAVYPSAAPGAEDPSAGPVDATPAPTEEPSGLLGAKFAEKFAQGDEVVYTENGYSSKNVCVEMSRNEMTVQGYPVVFFVADIYIRDISSFRCAVSQKENQKEWVKDMAKANNAIVAVSGDYFVFHRSGLAIRNGVIYREKLHPDQDVCVLYKDGTMETYLKGQVDLDYIKSRNPYHAWSFGPKLLENGMPMVEFNTSVETWNPRCAIGYYEPGHYCMVLVDGRQTGYSYGLEMGALSRLMYTLGCKEAYNLDGGMTAMMAYHDELYSQPCGGGRRNCDILYIAEPLLTKIEG